jgi:hypothetical protein
LVQTELKPVLQPYGADRFFSLCFEDGVLPSRAVVLSAALAHKLLLAATEKDWAQVKVQTG